jgi:hypothetical protein
MSGANCRVLTAYKHSTKREGCYKAQTIKSESVIQRRFLKAFETLKF